MEGLHLNLPAQDSERLPCASMTSTAFTMDMDTVPNDHEQREVILALSGPATKSSECNSGIEDEVHVLYERVEKQAETNIQNTQTENF